MPVDVGDNLFINTCSQVRKGWLLRQYDRNGRELIVGTGSAGKLPVGGDEGDQWYNGDIYRCEITGGPTFEVGKMLRLKIKLPGKCPFFDHEGITWTATAVWEEAEFVVESNEPTGNANTASSNGSGTLTKASPTATFTGPDSGASATVDVAISDPSPEDPDVEPTITITATFGGFDRDVDGSGVIGDDPVVVTPTCGVLQGDGGGGSWSAHSPVDGTTRWAMTVTIEFLFGDFSG